MNALEWLKPGIYGAIVGAISFGVIGFTWGGWVTGGTAEKMASTMAHDKLVTRPRLAGKHFTIFDEN